MTPSLEPLRARCDLAMHVGTTREMILPRHVLHGDGAARDLAGALPSWGISAGTALIVADQFLVDNHVLDSMFDSLRSVGLRLSVFSDFTGEPTLAIADTLADVARGLNPDVVIGVGGGSALDLAKVAGLLARNPGAVRQHLGIDLEEKPTAPLVLIPTTTGTGAEATRIAMLADDAGKRVISHRHLMPLATVLDPTLTVGLPGSVTAATGMDALAHAVESCMSTNSTALTASMSLRATELLVNWLPRAVVDPEHLPARRATLYGAFLAGVALNAGVVVGHSMAYTVANRTHLAHGVTCAMALPFCIAFNASGVSRDVDALAPLLTGDRSSDLLDGAEATLELTRSLGLPTTPIASGIAPNEEQPMAHECGTAYPRPSNPVAMTPEHLGHLYKAWFAGNLRGASLPERARS